jgi:tetratricopeptide repeat protein/biogenesis AIM24-like protein
MTAPRAPFDQGLFLTHFNKGKQFYDQRQFAEAEQQLEEAYLLRPRDPQVLNLLGLVYFKQEKLEKAEEIYRKLAAESPEAPTLFYNLGLICFKLNRLEEAESAFLKALDLAKDNPKINFYLGYVYERLQRYQDAIYQYRQAGASLMVRRVEDKLAAGAKSRPFRAARPPAPAAKPRLDDTAEFKKGELRDPGTNPDSTLVPGKEVRPVSDVLMADGAPRHEKSKVDTNKFRIPSAAMLAAGEAARGAPAEAVGSKTLPPRRPQIFHSLGNNLVEVDFSGKVFIKQGTVYSYSGNLTFWVKDPRPGGHPALVIITGTGKLILTDKGREITFMQVEDETVYVEPSHLLACEETLTPRYMPLGEAPAKGPALEVLALEGRGMVALSVASKPISLTVTPALPVSVPSSSIITWKGDLTAHVVDDRQLYEVVLRPGGPGALVRLEGTGRLLVEQAGN